MAYYYDLYGTATFFFMLTQRENEGYCLGIDNYDKRAVLAKMILRIGEPLNEIPGFKR